MKNKKVTVLTICVVFLLIALIGVSAFCIHIMNKENNETKEVVSSEKDSDADDLSATKKDNETALETTESTSQEVIAEPTPAPTPEPTPEPPALNMVQAELHRKYHNDELTANLLEKGYFHEVNKTLVDGAFEVNLVGFTGDTSKPMILLDVLVNDESLLDAEDNIAVRLYCLGTYQYENMLDSYGSRVAYGVRDAENSKLFHISMPGPSAWISPGQEFIVDVIQISIGSGEEKDNSWVEYDVNNMEYLVKLPEDSILSRYSYAHDNAVFEDDRMKYTLDIVTPGYYDTTLMFYMDYSNSQIANMEQNADFLNALYYKRDDFMKDLVVTINDVEYKGTLADNGAVTVDDDSCYFYTDLPGTNDTLIYSIVVTHGETSYVIK